MNYFELLLIAGDVEGVDFDNLPAEKKERYAEYVEAMWKQVDTVQEDGEPLLPQYAQYEQPQQP